MATGVVANFFCKHLSPAIANIHALGHFCSDANDTGLSSAMARAALVTYQSSFDRRKSSFDSHRALLTAYRGLTCHSRRVVFARVSSSAQKPRPSHTPFQKAS